MRDREPEEEDEVILAGVQRLAEGTDALRAHVRTTKGVVGGVPIASWVCIDNMAVDTFVRQQHTQP